MFEETGGQVTFGLHQCGPCWRPRRRSLITTGTPARLAGLRLVDFYEGCVRSTQESGGGCEASPDLIARLFLSPNILPLHLNAIHVLPNHPPSRHPWLRRSTLNRDCVTTNYQYSFGFFIVIRPSVERHTIGIEDFSCTEYRAICKIRSCTTISVTTYKGLTTIDPALPAWILVQCMMHGGGLTVEARCDHTPQLCQTQTGLVDGCPLRHLADMVGSLLAG
ncbi:hypothetical protein IF1G_10660 [Cordyceps javanica]|uniref:Uncharacterized protein n=1 Tax=Cordyceps javanica TaxID=43265 RepID=A0A545UML0_9HYPO|nr:hypothetical protein IF1G_10660 [Cordyceps javanica]